MTTTSLGSPETITAQGELLEELSYSDYIAERDRLCGHLQSAKDNGNYHGEMDMLEAISDLDEKYRGV